MNQYPNSLARKGEYIIFFALALCALTVGIAYLVSNTTLGLFILGSSAGLYAIGSRLRKFWNHQDGFYSLKEGILRCERSDGADILSIDLTAGYTYVIIGLFGETYPRITHGYAQIRIEAFGKVVYIAPRCHPEVISQLQLEGYIA